jgi:aspartate aminotransferase, cytoplasmic
LDFFDFCDITVEFKKKKTKIKKAWEKMSSSSSSTTTKNTWFDSVPEEPEDAIFGIKRAYEADTDERKLNLGIGAYRTEDGRPYVLRCVIAAEERMLALEKEGKLNKEYLPIDGLPDFRRVTAELMYGKESAVLAHNRLAAIQTISGTGAVRVGAEFLRRLGSPDVAVYLSDPTWGNHRKIMEHAGFAQVRTYAYYDDASRSINIDGMLADLGAAEAGSIVLLQPCAHNPTGLDPSEAQWASIAGVCEQRSLLPFFDCAYQGYASGCLTRDAFAVRLFAERGFRFLLAQSYSKNFGLYGERAGMLSAVCATAESAAAVASQLKSIARGMYSNPPKHGALIVNTVLNDDELRAQWIVELKSMAQRIADMRAALHAALVERKTPGDWSHITGQSGMFSYTGLTRTQVALLTEKYHIYLSGSGRISIAGLSAATVPYLADAIHDAVTNH